jgi:hypothetical protein
MIKKIFFFIFFISGSYARSQNAYQDAIELQKYIRNDKFDETYADRIDTILSHYLLKFHTIPTTFDSIHNPFIYIYFRDINTHAGALPLSSVASSIGGMDVTNFAEGIARFLAERANQELSAAFFTKMKQQFGYFPELKVLFPSTYQLLMNIENYSYATVIQALKGSFETDVQNLQYNLYNLTLLDSTACICDTAVNTKKSNCKLCKNHPNSILCRSECDECHSRMNKIDTFFNQTTGGLWAKASLHILQTLSSGSTPAGVLDELAKSNEMDSILSQSKARKQKASYDVASAVKLTNLISQSFLSDTSSQIWVSPQDIGKLFKGEGSAFQIYLGLLYQQISNNNIKFFNSDSTIGLTSLIDNNIATFNSDIKPFIQQLSAKMATANAAFKKINASNNKGEKVDINAVYNCYKSSSDITKLVLGLKIFKQSKITEIQTKGTEILSILDPAVDLFYHSYTKNYTSLVWDATALITNVNQAVDDGLFDVKSKTYEMKSPKPKPDSTIMVKTITIKIVNIDSIRITSTSRDTIKTIKKDTLKTTQIDTIRSVQFVEFFSKKDSVEKINTKRTNFLSSDARSSLIKYGSLISGVASAQSSDEVKKAIEAAALPVGSASIKKNTRCNIAVNAYVGGYYGGAYTKVPSGGFPHKYLTSPTYGLTAPIGVSFSWGIPCKNNNNSSISILLQLIDVGALVNFYLIHGDSTAMPTNFKVNLVDIFAPGMQLSYGFPRIPVSLVGGVQLVPEMLQVSEATSTNNTAFRVHIGLVVDIPMFNIKVWDFKKNKSSNTTVLKR